MALPGVFAYLANNLPFKLLGYLTESTQVLESRKKTSPAPAFSPDVGCTGAGRVCTAAYRAQPLPLPEPHVPCPQDGPRSSECVLELEGLEVAVEAQVECEPPPDTWCRAKCQQHQVRTMGGCRRWPRARL